MALKAEDYLKNRNVVSFEVYPAAVLGNRFDNVKVEGVFGSKIAKNYIDPEAMHINVYPTLPNGVPDDPDMYDYVLLKHTNGSYSVLGIPWIREDTIEIYQKGTLTLKVDDVGPEDRTRIVRALAANGYKVASIAIE